MNSSAASRRSAIAPSTTGSIASSTAKFRSRAAAISMPTVATISCSAILRRKRADQPLEQAALRTLPLRAIALRHSTLGPLRGCSIQFGCNPFQGLENEYTLTQAHTGLSLQHGDRAHDEQ